MMVKIRLDARNRHQYPDWPWYLGYFEQTDYIFKPKYIRKYEGQEFEVYEHEYWPDKWVLKDKEWAKKHLGNEMAWIDKEDAIVVA